MQKLLQMLKSLIGRVEALHPHQESREWYLLNNLYRFKKVAENWTSQHDFDNAEHVLTRFNVDSMDWGDPLFKEATDVTEQARRVKL